MFRNQVTCLVETPIHPDLLPMRLSSATTTKATSTDASNRKVIIHMATKVPCQENVNKCAIKHLDKCLNVHNHTMKYLNCNLISNLETLVRKRNSKTFQ